MRLNTFFIFVTGSLSSCLVIQSAAAELPTGFVSIADAEPSILVDARYFTAHNFVGAVVRGYKASKCILSKPAADALIRVQKEARALQMTVKVYDCYRPQQAVDHFVEWASDVADTKMKKEFYPYVDKKNLFRDGYIARRSGHSRGSTLDLTLVSLPPKSQPVYRDGDPLVECVRNVAERYADNSIDMGTGYDCFDVRSHTAAINVSAEAKRNRSLLKSMMEKAGFKNLPEEWWHYTLVNEPYPETYFNFPVE